MRSRQTAPSTASLRWSGHWIGHRAEGRDRNSCGFSDWWRRRSRVLPIDVPDGHSILQVLPAEAPARITADSRYVLWVNGHEVGRGPVRSQPLPAALRQLRPGAVPLCRRQRHRRPGHLLRAADVVLAAGSGWFQHRRRTRLRSAGRRSDARLRRQLACPAIGRLVAAGRYPRR